MNAELEKGLSVKTIRDSLRVLKMILRFGARRGEWTLSDFSVRFPVSCERRRPLQVLTKHHCTLLQRFLETHPSPRNMGLLICLNSGLRIGEVCGLQWGDIDLRTGLVHIRRTVQHIWIRDGDVRADWMEIGMPKTATSVRDIPLSREIQELLRPAKKASKPGHYVVTGSPEPLEPRYLTKPYRPSWATPPSPPPWTSTFTPAPPRSAASLKRCPVPCANPLSYRVYPQPDRDSQHSNYQPFTIQSSFMNEDCIITY